MSGTSEKSKTAVTFSRRTLLQSAAVTVPVSLTGCAALMGEKVPMVRTSDPVARAVAYYSDTRDVDPNDPLAANHDVSQSCGNCVHQRGHSGSGRIDCPKFPGRNVSDNGWCSIWAQG